MGGGHKGLRGPERKIHSHHAERARVDRAKVGKDGRGLPVRRRGEVDAVYYDNSYYLVPDEHGEKPYYLMLGALEQNNKVAVGRVVMHEKEHLVALRPYDGAILMTTLHYTDEVRTPRDFPELKKPPEVEKEELELAGQLIKIMKKPFNFKEYRDRYQENLMKLVEAKMKGREEVIELRVPEIKPTKNLMEALKASIKAQEKR